MDFFERVRRSNQAIAILFLIIGIVLFMFPGASGKLICTCFGVMLLLQGITMLIPYFKNSGYRDVMHFEFFLGMILIAAGLFVIFRSGVLIKIISYLVGIYIVVRGLKQLQLAINDKRSYHQNWQVSMFFAVCTLMLGIFLICAPWKAAAVTIRFIGAIFIYQGIVNLWMSHTMSGMR